MAKPFHFDLVSPERMVLSEDVTQVDVPGAEGVFGVLADHAPLMSTLRPGVIVVTRTGGETRRIFVRGGFADVNPAGLTILAEQAIPVEDLKADTIADQIRVLEEDARDATTDEGKRVAQLKLDQMREVEAVLRTSGAAH